jgi:phospholipid/cholesterol/gamma-HCH transport system permease protein
MATLTAAAPLAPLPPATPAKPAQPAAPAPQPAPLAWAAALGQHVAERGRSAMRTITFIGEVLQALGRLLRGRSTMRLVDLAWQVDQTGPTSVPVVALVVGLVGVIIAYMGAAQLQRFGAQSFIADLVSVGVVREMAALMTGMMLAGRVGAAFAAQLGSMQANDEIDALRTLGINPIDQLVLPRMLAMLLVAPLLTAMAATVGVAAGAVVAVWVFGILPADFWARTLAALDASQITIGLVKGTVYAVLVALAGCLEGLAAGRSAQAVGQAATTAVVKGIVWIVVSASVMTIMLQRLGW